MLLAAQLVQLLLQHGTHETNQQCCRAAADAVAAMTRLLLVQLLAINCTATIVDSSVPHQ
jgi:hypothetical protein